MVRDAAKQPLQDGQIIQPGQTIDSEFTIANVGNRPIVFDQIGTVVEYTLAGQRSFWQLRSAIQQNIALKPRAIYTHRGKISLLGYKIFVSASNHANRFVIDGSGRYRFLAAYSMSGQWVRDIPILGEGKNSVELTLQTSQEDFQGIKQWLQEPRTRQELLKIPYPNVGIYVSEVLPQIPLQ